MKPWYRPGQRRASISLWRNRWVWPRKMRPNGRGDRIRGVLFQTGYFMRGSPIFRFLKEQLVAGAFGKVTRVRMINCHAGSLKGWFDTEWRWMADPAQAGVGGFGDLGTHALDILLWLFGPVSRVTADIDVATGRYGDCDEYGEGLLKFENGTIGSLAAGWVDVAQPVTLTISGTEGHAHVADGQLYLPQPACARGGWENALDRSARALAPCIRSVPGCSHR
jgi:predicted dehydrogenase